MSTRSTLFLVALAFAVGWMCSKYAAQGQFQLPFQTAEPDAHDSGSTAKTAETRAVADPAPSSAAASDATPTARITPVLPSGPNRIVEPRRDAAAPSDDGRLVDLIRDRFPEAKLVVRKTNPDGTFVSKETLEDGGTISKSFNAQGTLTGEDWRVASGDEVIRTYFDSGSIKGFSLKAVDGTITDVTFTQSGLFKARSDDYPDGSHLYTNYDDQGQVLEKWRKDKDGKTIRVP